MADQIATVSKQGLKSRIGTLSREDMQAVQRAIAVQLGISPA
jgi:mRNA-degrading endonuclease toxin of MazEF toxin-antitoxin module